MSPEGSGSGWGLGSGWGFGFRGWTSETRDPTGLRTTDPKRICTYALQSTPFTEFIKCAVAFLLFRFSACGALFARFMGRSILFDER